MATKYHPDAALTGADFILRVNTCNPLFATTPKQSDFAIRSLSAADALSRAVHIPYFNSNQQYQANADLAKQTTGTSISEPSVSTNRIHRHTQRASFKCTNCDKIFCRSDVLRRHINEKHAGRREEFLCPNMGCKKSQKGHGFKRRDKLEKHKIDSCKGRVRVTSSNQSTASTSPMTVSTPDDATDAPCIRQESSPAARIDNEAGSDVGTLQNQDVILKLQRRYRAEHEALLMKEEECQEMRKRLASLHAVIELVQGSSTATSI